MHAFVFAHVFSIVAGSVGVVFATDASFQLSRDNDDRPVILAILEQAVRPRAARESARATPVPPLFVFSRTSAMCKDAQEIGHRCVPLDEIEVVRDGGPAFDRPLEQVIESSLIRRELIESFKSRNQTSHALPRLEAQDVVMLSSPADVAKSRGTGHDPARGYSQFSRPAYSRQGFALVHDVYDCGPLCGSSHLFVLRKTGSRWQVVAVALLSIS
jgi:hypothetical protein